MSTRDKLLAAFHGRGGRLLSGADLARSAGVTRGAVWKQVRALQTAGVPIESDARSGYRMPNPSDFSLCSLRLPLSLQHWIRPHYMLSVPSTQIQAKAAADKGAPEGSLWIAEVQTEGRGRHPGAAMPREA